MSRFLLLTIAILVHATAFADGGAVRLRREAGGLAITVFTSPAALAAGPADLSVLVQDQNGLEPVLDADIFLLLHESSTGAQFEAQATRQNAQNKLLYASPVMFSRPGKWELTVTVKRTSQLVGVGGILDVAPAPAEASYMAYIAFPPAMVALFAVRERLLRRRLQR